MLPQAFVQVEVIIVTGMPDKKLKVRSNSKRPKYSKIRKANEIELLKGIFKII